MPCLYKYNNEWITKEELLDIFDQNETLFDILEVGSIQPNYEKFVNFKTTLKNKLQNQIPSIDEKIKSSTDIDLIKKLNKLKNNIEIRLNGSEELGIKGLEEEIFELNAASPKEKLRFYFDSDFKRLDELVNSKSPEDIDEVKNIIGFYRRMANFNSEHPLFSDRDMYNTQNDLILPQDLVNMLRDYSAKADEYDKRLQRVEKDSLVNNISNIQKVKKNADLTYDSLFSSDTGLKDATWIDMFIMDTTNGIFSHNGIIPQVGQEILRENMEKELLFFKDISKRLLNIEDKAAEELGKIDNGKYKLDKLGILGVRGVSWDMFRAKYKNGLSTDYIVQRYSPEYINERSKMYSEFNNSIKDALAEQDKQLKIKKFGQAFNKKLDWHKRNSIFIDITKIPEISSNNKFDKIKSNFKPNLEYKQYLISILGENGYKEEVEKQEKLLEDYLVKKELFEDNLLDKYNITQIKDNEAASKDYSLWLSKNDPFDFLSKYNSGESFKVNHTAAFNHYVPARKLSILSQTAKGEMYLESGKDSGYYDSTYSQIESSPELLEFYNILRDVTNKIHDSIPSDMKDKFSANSIPALKKNIQEIVFDSNNNILERIVKAFKELLDWFRTRYGIDAQSNFSQLPINESGLPEYKINTSFLKNNKDRIDQLYTVESIRLKKALNNTIGKFSRYDKFNINKVDDEVLSIISENTGVPVEKIGTVFGTEIELFKILRDGIVDQVVSENSFDLPKIIRYYSHAISMYQGRQKALPMLSILKQHYEDIKKPSLTNTGELIRDRTGKIKLEGLRENAINQFDSWFNRVVLGNYGKKPGLGSKIFKRISDKVIDDEDKRELFKEKLKSSIDGFRYNENEKLLLKKLPAIKSELNYIINTSQQIDEINEATSMLNSIINVENKLGKDFNLNSFVEPIFDFIRFLGLGYNLSSSITNFLEGQIVNFNIAASGDYFKPENIYRANNIVKGSFLKNITFNQVATDGAKKARILMDRFDVFQDVANELQKASTKSAFSKFKPLGPFELIRRTEYLNQTPLMIARLLDEEITGKDGSKSNVWDALDSEGNLTENFATKENKDNWENANGQQYFDFKSSVNKMIVNSQGDYDPLRGNKASEHVSGQAIMMFKRWMGRQFYQRFAVEQMDIESGVGKFKGRFRSHTKVSGAIHGGIIGFAGLSFIGAGPVGLMIGLPIGYLGSKFMGVSSEVGALGQLSTVSREIFMNLLRLPVNTITGKKTIRDIDINNLQLSQRDAANLKANLVDMSITLAWVAMLLFTKALFWDDDDEEDSVKRKTHNLLANRFMQLSGQSAMYLNPIDTWDSTFGNIALLRFFDNVGKTATATQDALEGRDILQSGPHAGESRLWNQTQKTFLPGILKDQVGFSTQTERQFVKSTFDDWFYGEERNAQQETRRIRAEYKESLEEKGLKEEEIEKLIKERYPNKKKGQTYEELLKQYQ